MTQPSWKVVFRTDDDVLLEDTTGVHPPELEHAEEACEGVILYRVTLRPMGRYQTTAQLALPGQSDLRVGDLVDVIDYRGSQHAPWFENDHHTHCADKKGYCPYCARHVSKRLDDAARCAGRTPTHLRELFCSASVEDRVEAYTIIANYEGWMNFDHDPTRLSKEQLNERWGKY